MSRNIAGTYSLPVTGNPVIPGTTVSSTWANATLADLATETTNSLDRYGRGPMLAPLQMQDGSAGAPSLTFQSEPAAGLYREATNDVRMMVAGTLIQKWNASTTTCTGLVADTATVNGNVTLAGSNPAGTTAFSNVITKKNVAKAWATVRTDGAGGFTILDSFNVASVALLAGAVSYATVTWAQAFSTQNYALLGTTCDGRIIGTYGGAGTGKTTTYARVAAYTSTSSVTNLGTTAVEFSVIVYGQQ